MLIPVCLEIHKIHFILCNWDPVVDLSLMRFYDKGIRDENHLYGFVSVVTFYLL